MITRDRELPLDTTLINGCIAQFDLSAERLSTLYEYYSGDHAINDRVRTTGLPNNLLVHAYPQYIVTMTSGYLIGDPVQYTDGKQEAPLQALQEAYDAADVQSVDAELALGQAIFGRGVELLYVNQNAMPRATAIDPQHAFVVYDDTAEALPLFGVHRLMGIDVLGFPYVRGITVYTDKEIIEYEATTQTVSVVLGQAGNELTRVPHQFGHVPVIEYWNNSVTTGDFEQVTTLIDAYDILQSDRINDKDQFANALLVLTGVVGFDAAATTDTRTPAQRLREEGTLTLPDVGAKAEYLIKQLNEADTDILRAALRADIHKFACVPDLSDEKFAGNASGVAMKYKLFGLEQLTKIKERWFREGLRWRLRMVANFLSVKGFPKLDADKVQMTFRRSLPVNEMEIAQMVSLLKGIVADSDLLAQIPFIEDVQAAQDALDKQKQEGIAAQAAAFGAFPNANDTTTDTATKQGGTNVE